MTKRMTAGCALLLLLAACRAEPPQQPPAAKPAAVPAIQRDSFTYGKHHHAIQSSSPDAQRFFDLGMAQVFGFHHEAAIRSFERASQIDPGAAMPHWGRAWALGPNYNLDIDDPRAKQAYEAITRARALAKNTSDAEHAYVEALAVRYSPDMKADRAELARKYSRAMGDLSKRYPDDLDAATLYAESLMNLTPWKLWTLDGKPGADTPEIVSVLESVLKRDPNHLGANHYYIHAVEASREPGRALASADRLRKLAESSGHLLHMPAHVYARTGDHAGAAAANAAGAAADRRYMVNAPAGDLYPMMYYPHNLHFLADSQMMLGNLRGAKEAAARVAEHLNPHAAMMPMIESMVVTPVSVLLRFGRHAEILALPQPPADRPVQTAWHHFARGVALARSGKVDEAAAERKTLTSAIATVPATALFGGTGLIDARTVLNVAGFVLDARIASARKDHLGAVKLWQRAVAAVDLLPYDEPPVWFYPVRESLGAELLRAHLPIDAERVFNDDLDRHPRNPRSLFGLRESLIRQGADADAARLEKEFQDGWKLADTKLTLDDL